MEKVFMFNFEEDAKKLRDLKRVLGNRQLAIEVQTLEGNFFHNIVTKHMLENRYFDVPFTIKHDSITLPISQASYLIDELNKLIREFFQREDINFKFDVL
jgi:predicted alternative tryptophan synthase beta-subunit